MSEASDTNGCSGVVREADPAAYLFLGLMVLIGSSTATAAKFAVRELPVGLLPLVRFGGAGLCLLPLVSRGGAWRRMVRQDAGWLLAAAALCVPVNQTFFLSATRLAPTSHVGLIYAACPLVVLLLASALGQERLEWRRLAGVLASVAGVVVIGLGNLWSGHPSGRDVLRGDFLTVGAVASWGAYLTISKRLVARHGALPALAATFLLGSALQLPVALTTFAGWPPLSSAGPAAWRSLAYLTLVVTVFGLAFQHQALRRLDASQVAVVGNVAPVLTVVWGVWLFAEPVTPALLFGGVLTLGGVLWTSRPDRRPSLAPPPAATRRAGSVGPPAEPVMRAGG
jgi:drug/metabolite transporter (DMT)-like permease